MNLGWHVVAGPGGNDTLDEVIANAKALTVISLHGLSSMIMKEVLPALPASLMWTRFTEWEWKSGDLWKTLNIRTALICMRSFPRPRQGQS